jgi:hypothetical protein
VLWPRGRKEKGGEGERRRKGKEKKEKEEKKKKRKKEGKKRKGKEEKEKKGKENKERKEKKIGERFLENLGKLLGGIWGGVFAGFSRFSGVGAFSRDGGDGEANLSSGPWRARDSRPVADRGVGKARTGAGLGAVPAAFAARASGERGEKQWLGFEW